MAYFLSHWRGKLSLNVSLWINFVGLLVAISLIEIFVISRLTSNPAQLIQTAIISLFITRLIIFPWQLIGLFRAVDSDFIQNRQILKTRSIQAFALLSILFTLVYSLELMQSVIFYKRQLAVYSQPAANTEYVLKLLGNGRQLEIRGGLDFGVTKSVRETLQLHPEISSVVLSSRGGQIYEGRGLAKLFSEYELDIYVFQECSSACATAYIGGKKRYLGKDGKLGFHQYKMQSSNIQQFISFYNTQAEQERDTELFRAQGIDEAFLKRMFYQPASQIWFPDHQTLLDATIVNKLLSE